MATRGRSQMDATFTTVEKISYDNPNQVLESTLWQPNFLCNIQCA